MYLGGSIAIALGGAGMLDEVCGPDYNFVSEVV